MERIKLLDELIMAVWRDCLDTEGDEYSDIYLSFHKDKSGFNHFLNLQAKNRSQLNPLQGPRCDYSYQFKAENNKISLKRSMLKLESTLSGEDLYKFDLRIKQTNNPSLFMKKYVHKIVLQIPLDTQVHREPE